MPQQPPTICTPRATQASASVTKSFGEMTESNPQFGGVQSPLFG
jgi:hypothetical protein